MRRPFLLLSCLGLSILIGCADAPRRDAPSDAGPPGEDLPRAPDGVDALTRFLFREWAHENASVMEEGVAKLELELLKRNLMSDDYGDRSFALSAPTREDLATINWPEDQNPASCTTNVSVAYVSKWPVNDHATVQISPDQLALEPTAKAYTRSFVTPTDPSCFPSLACPLFETLNHVTRKNFFIEVTFDLHKDFRWVKLPNERWAILARAWTDRVYPGVEKDTAINQSYSLDVFMGQPNGTTLRYLAHYSDSKIAVMDPDLLKATLTSSTDDTLQIGDAVIGKRLHGE